MKDFIRRNIQKVKGGERAVTIEKNKTPVINKLRNNGSMQNRLRMIEQKFEQIEARRQHDLMNQLLSIKDDIKLIKSHLFNKSNKGIEESHVRSNASYQYNKLLQEGRKDTSVENKKIQIQSYEMNSDEFRKNRSGYIQIGKSTSLGEYLQMKKKRMGQGILLKALTAVLKDYKLESPERGAVFFGYSKRTMQAVAVRWYKDSVGTVVEVYDRLWKNIGAARWPCLTKVLDYKDDQYPVIVFERARGSILGLPSRTVALDILRILQFIHDSGFLFRNVEPDSFLLNDQRQMVAIGFSRARRYVDIRGHFLDIQESEWESPFASNSQVRGISEGRKDDLEALGYLALLLLGLEIPWLGCNREQTIKVRSGLVLNELYKGHLQWVAFMAHVLKTPRNDKPDYKKLAQILEG